MKTSNANKVISVLMSVAMCPMMVSSAAFAADDDTASGGSSPSTELTQFSSQAEGTDTGANSGTTPATQLEATGEAAGNGATLNENAAPGSTTGEDGTTAVVAQIDSKSYSSLQEAINAAQDGETVTLLADVTEDVTITASKNITLNLGGKTLTNTNAGKATISVQCGTVTVKNGNVAGGTSYYNI